MMTTDLTESEVAEYAELKALFAECRAEIAALRAELHPVISDVGTALVLIDGAQAPLGRPGLNERGNANLDAALDRISEWGGGEYTYSDDIEATL